MVLAGEGRGWVGAQAVELDYSSRRLISVETRLPYCPLSGATDCLRRERTPRVS